MGIQEEVDIFMNRYGISIKPEYRALDVAAEFGELAKALLTTTNYGDEVIEKNDAIEEEVGDLYFSLILFANRLNIDLDVALDKVMDKYREKLEAKDTPSSEPKTVKDY